MESTFLGLVLDTSFLVTAERRKMTPRQAIQSLQVALGVVPIVLSSMTIAEVGHGIYRANDPETRVRRRMFLDELKATIPIYPVTTTTAEIVAQIGGEEAAKGVNLPIADLIIGACALELGYALGTSNIRHFKLIPGLTLSHL